MDEQMQTARLSRVGERYLSLYTQQSSREQTGPTLKQQFTGVCWGTAASLLALGLAALWPR